MDKNSSTVRRSNILTLDLREIKRSLPSILQTKLIVSRENKESKPLSQSVMTPWMLSSSNQIVVSRNKVSHELLHHCRNGFILDDPFIRKTRFFVDYHRMHDPGLERYYNSIPVRNRMKKLELVTNENDAICSRKEFAEYLRYLDSNLTQNINHSTKLQRERRLEENFKRLKTQKKNDAQFTSIFRRRRPRFGLSVDTKAMNKEKKRKLRKQIESEEKAVERMLNIRNEKSQTCRLKNQDKQEKFWPRKKEMIQSEKEKRIELGMILDSKIEKARQRKESMQTQKQIEKMHEEIDYFKKHALFRQEALLKNIELYDLYKEQQRRNMEQRDRKIQEIRENNGVEIIKMRKAFAKKERKAEIADRITENIDKLKKKYVKQVDPSELDEINRRISMLTQTYVVDCVEKQSIILRSLRIGVPSFVLAASAIRMIELGVIIIPEFGATQCVVVHQRVARLISKTIQHYGRERVKLMKESWQRQQQRQSMFKEMPSSKKNLVNVAEETKVIGESSYGEFIGDLNPAGERRLTIFYDLNDEIKREMHVFFEHITKNKLEFSEKFNERDFVHLYDFQKYFLNKAMRRLMEVVKIKTYYYWNEKKKIKLWKHLDMKLVDLSNEAAEAVMTYPHKIKEFSEIVRKISRFLCVDIMDKLEMENIGESKFDYPDDFDGITVISDTGSDDE